MRISWVLTLDSSQCSAQGLASVVTMPSKTGPWYRRSWSRDDWWSAWRDVPVCSQHLVSVSHSSEPAVRGCEPASQLVSQSASQPVHQHIKMSVYRGQVASPHTLTLVTLGDAAVGKTSLINRFCSDTFNEVRKCVWRWWEQILT